MKNRSLLKPFLISFTCLAFFFSGCASKQKTVPPPYIDQPGSPNASSVPKPDPQAFPIPSELESPKPVAEGQSVILALGGAGVASFATVGFLKRLQEEGIKVDSIVATGWPALFALGYGFLKSVHDLEWFAMRLEEKDFYKAGVFDANQGYHSHENLSQLIQNFFTKTELSDSRVPIVISASNSELGDPEIFDSGDWKTPLLKTLSVPGIYRPYAKKEGEEQGITSLQGIDVSEAARRGGAKIFVLEMYDDYFNFIKKNKKNSSDTVFRNLYLAQLKKSLQSQVKDQPYVGRIYLHSEPTDFSSKRAAILAGYKEAAKLSKLLRKNQ